MAIPDLGHQHIDAALAADTAPTTAHHRQPGAGIDASERSISTQHAYTTAAAHGGSDARRLPRMSALCICVPLMFALMLGVFAGSLSGAIITWRKYEVRFRAARIDVVLLTRRVVVEATRSRHLVSSIVRLSFERGGK